MKMNDQTSPLSKEALIDRLCELLGVNDSTALEPAIQTIGRAINVPIHAIMITWNPAVPNSMSFGLLNIPMIPEALQAGAEVCLVVSKELGQKALALAKQQGYNTEQARQEPGQ